MPNPKPEEIAQKYPISSEIVYPGARSKQPRLSLYGFERLEPGDSFPVAKGEAQRVRSSAYLFGQKHKRRYSVRSITNEKGELEWRCWRLKPGEE